VGSPDWYLVRVATSEDDPPLVETRLHAGEDPEPTRIVAASVRVLQCSLVGPRGESVRLRSARAARQTGSSRGVIGINKKKFGLAWLPGDEAISVSLSGLAPGGLLEGTITLTDPDQPCVVHAQLTH